MHFVILLYALFASVFTIAKSGLEYTEPLFFMGSRMVIAGIFLLGYLYFFDRKKLSFNKRFGWQIFRLALFNIYFTNVFEFWGLQYLTSFKTCFIYSLSPFLSALFSFTIFNEKMTVKKWIGLFIGFVGFIPVLLGQTSSEENAGQFLFLSWPEISVILAAICSVYGWILLRQLVKEGDCSTLMANGASMFIGGLIALVHSGFTETWDPIPTTKFLPFFESTILLVIISNLIAYNLYGFLLKKYTATLISFAGFVTPLFTALFGWVFLGEIVTWPFYLSSAIVLMGLTMFYQEELKLGYYAAKSKPQTYAEN